MRDVVTLAIDPTKLAAFEALADREASPNRRQWTPEEDALLLEYWPRKNHEAVAKSIGVDTKTALRRFRELTA